MNEITKLAVLLAKENIPFELNSFIVSKEPTLQICSPNKKNAVVDAVCHEFSYGGPEGLIEVLGSRNVNKPNDDVVGWLTAEEAIVYFREK